MDFKTILFYAFALILILAATRVITARNPVHAVLFLVLSFFSAAGIWMLLQAEFLAIVLVLVYVGAVMVLFLFVVMMLDIDFAELRAGFVSYLPFGLLIALVLLAEIILGIGLWSAGPIELAQRAAPTDPNISNIKAVGMLLYTRYIFLFEAAGLVLLVAMIGAIVLTHRARGGVKGQNIAKQNRRRPQDAVRNINQPIGQGVEL